MMLNSRKAIFLAALAALACSKPTDLGSNSGWLDLPEDAAAKDEAQILYDNPRELVFGLALQDTTLFALVRQDGDSQLVSCPVARCGSERTILARGGTSAEVADTFTKTPLVIVGGQLAWFVGPHGAIATCPTTGCDEPNVVESGPIDGNVDGLAADGESVYWTSGWERSSIWRLRVGESTPQLVRHLSTRPTGIVTEHDEFFYYATEDGISRARKDGTADPEVVVEEREIHGMAAGADALYYTTRTLAGRIVRCPWSAACEATSLVKGQRFPAVLRHAGTELFWLSFPFGGIGNGLDKTGKLSSCRLPECDEVQDADVRFDKTTSVAASSSFLVWTEPGAIRSLSR